MERSLRLVLALTTLAGACGGDDAPGGACGAADGDYVVVFGPGTGTCADLDLAELSDRTGVVTIGPGAACDAIVVMGTHDGDDCSIEISIDAEVTTDGVVDGRAEVHTDCTPTPCEHSFAITFERIAAADD